MRRVTLVSPGTALAVGRLTDDGRPDERFGTHGTVVTDAGAKYAAGATAVAVQRDRKILVFGWSARTAPDPQQEGKLGDLTIVRCRADGRLDPTFGTEGTSRTDLNGDFVAGALDRDGKIVVAATSFFHSSALARYRPNGRLDPSFGSAGKESLVTANRRWSGPVAAIAVQRDGKIVVTGYAGGVVTSPDLAVARYLPDGRLDERFGSGGNSILDLGRDSMARAMAVDGGGRIVVAGSIRSPCARSLHRWRPPRRQLRFGRQGDRRLRPRARGVLPSALPSRRVPQAALAN